MLDSCFSWGTLKHAEETAETYLGFVVPAGDTIENFLQIDEQVEDPDALVQAEAKRVRFILWNP
jgi:hypothetical protein